MKVPGIQRQKEWNKVTIERMLKVYRKRRPAQWKALLKHAERTRQHLRDEKGFSEDKSMMLSCICSEKLDSYMKTVFHRFWKDDPLVREPYEQVFRKLRINPTSKAPYRDDVPTMKDGAVREKRQEVVDELMVRRQWLETLKKE